MAARRGQGAAVDARPGRLRRARARSVEGARVVQMLSIAGGLKLDLEITRYDPPRGAESPLLDQRHRGSRATSWRERRRDRADPDTGRQGGRDQGADADPGRAGPAREEGDRGPRAAQGRAGGLMRRVLARARRCCSSPRRRRRRSPRPRRARCGPTPSTSIRPPSSASAADAAALRAEIGDRADLHRRPARSAVEGGPGRTRSRCARTSAREGRYALVVGDEVRTLPAQRRAGPATCKRPLMEFVDRRDARDSSGGGGVDRRAVRDRAADRRSPPAACVLLVAAAASAPATARRTRERRNSARTSSRSATGSARSNSTSS